MRRALTQLFLFCICAVIYSNFANANDECAPKLAPPPLFTVEKAIPAEFQEAKNEWGFLKTFKEQKENELVKAKDQYSAVVFEIGERESRLGFFQVLRDLVISRPLKHLSDEEIEKQHDLLEKRLETLATDLNKTKSRIEKLEKDLESGSSRLLAAVQKSFKEFMQKNPEYSQTITDLLEHASVRSLDKERTVSLLMGSPWEDPSQGEIETAMRLVKGMTERGHTVILDGHSRLTPMVMSEFPEQTLSVSATPVEGILPERQVVISDPYLRWLAFAKQGRMVGSNSSNIAMGAMIYDSLNDLVLTKPTFNGTALSEWRKEVVNQGRDLGLPKYPHEVVKPEGTEAIVGRFKKVDREQFKRRTTSDLSLSEIEALVKSAEIVAAGKPVTALAKAVVFGSGRIDKDSARLVYDTSFDLSQSGIGVATGGSGGAMMASNMGAFDGGGVSIGIPIVGRNALKGEELSPTEFHTDTLQSEGYESRVPLLMHGKQVFVIAPGGSGTLRELVTVLVHFNQPEIPKGIIVFLDTPYYQGLIDFMTLPEMVFDRLTTADSREEVWDILKQVQEEGLLLLGEKQNLKPRGTRRSLPLE